VAPAAIAAGVWKFALKEQSAGKKRKMAILNTSLTMNIVSVAASVPEYVPVEFGEWSRLSKRKGYFGEPVNWRTDI
jgi:hypothetical protein